MAAIAGAVLAADQQSNKGWVIFRRATPLPGQVIDLTAWKISVPTTPDPTQIVMPQLADYSDASFRVVSAVQFTAPVGGGVQAGAKYPRSELREMNSDGTAAAWSTTQGHHAMELVQRVTHLPTVKAELVAGQIHDANEYVVLIRLSSAELRAEYNGKSVGVLDEQYVLNTVFTLRIEAGDGFIDVFYNGVRKVHQADIRDGCYFKAGCYTQSNESKGDSADDYGQVEILELTVGHTP